MLKAILFDLDMTLLDTSSLETYRQSQDWDGARGKYHLVSEFSHKSTLAHRLPLEFRTRGLKVGIVTSSPRRYARELVTKFDIVHDVLVAYEDTTEHKPDPAPLKLAITQLGLEPSEVAYVGDSPDDVVAAAHAGVLSIGAGWGVADWEEFRGSAPDILFRNPSRLSRTISFDPRRYFAESSASGHEPLAHGGSMLSWDDPYRSFALGRYFTTTDPRHATSKLSHLLLDFKTSDEPVPILARALASALHTSTIETEYIVSVPPKPSQVGVRDRFQSLFNELKGSPLHGKIIAGGLKCKTEIAGYKQMNPSERRLAVSGAFESKFTWNGKRVLLIDDVYTTNATTSECARVLLANNASSVTIVALGADQRSLPPSACPLCGSPVRTIRNRYGSRFIGCTAFWSPEKCRYTYSLDD